MQEILKRTLDSDLYEALQQVAFNLDWIALALTVQQMRPINIDGGEAASAADSTSTVPESDGRIGPITRIDEATQDL